MEFDHKPMSQCTIADYTARLEHMSQAPEVEEAYRGALQGIMAKACDELRYLDEHLDFKDRNFWFNLPNL
jgi:hypothetical protein